MTTEPTTPRLLRNVWPGRVAVRVSKHAEHPGLHAYLSRRARRDGLEVPRMGPFYLVPGAWLAELVSLFVTSPDPGHDLIIRRMTTEREADPSGPRTHCKHGHLYDTKNTRVRTDGTRACRACDRERKRESRS
ncbi:hypothetical protein [Streptosporangium sp. G12]